MIADSAPQPRLDYPECNTALMLYVEMFASNPATLGSQQSRTLSQLADSMNRCDNYRYLIETHADQHGSAEYNLKLSAQRSHSIAAYLIAKGVASERFETRFHGESQLVTSGDSAVDLAAIRRVVVTPFKIR